ncbi:MAG TPA: amidase [Acidimicrobiia bacterium]|nr:amidase [Acidimicrobiia bacterium]
MSSIDRVERALAAAHAGQVAFNIFTQLDDEAAMDRAALIDGADGDGMPALGLAGVPVGIKDLIDHEGRVTTAGSAFYRHESERSSPVVSRLEDAGAVVIGRTGLHEFAFGFSSENPHFGPVRNPWDPETSPGGSSGGSAAAVAADITPIAIGTDTGGSVRVPAALCGCFGLKVTHGRIPLDGVFPLAGSVDTVGPLASSIDGLDRSYRALSGDQSDWSREDLRLGVPEPWLGQAPTDDEVGSAFDEAVSGLGALGHQVTRIEMPGVLPAPELIDAIAGEVAQVHRRFREEGLPYGPDVAKRVDDCIDTSKDRIEAGRAWQGMIRSRFAAAFDDVDLVLTPTTPVMRKVIGEEMIGDRHYRAVLSWFSALVNHALLPAIALPLAGTGAPPVSLQAIGPLGSETALLHFGRTLEESGLVGFTPAPMASGST